jgi:Primase C terminal 1 (PriCT-1)
MVLDITSVNPRERIAGMFLEQLSYPLGADETIEIRHKLPGDNKLMRRRFLCDAVQAAQYVIELDGEDVYVGAAPRYGSDGTKAGVRRTNALWTDLDFKDGHTRESRLEQLRKLSCPPALGVATGGGLQHYWLLDRPAESPEELSRVELVTQRLAAAMGGDPVHDRSRVMRVPGTFNHKYGEPRPVVMEHYFPGWRHGLEELEAMTETFAPATGSHAEEDGKVPREILGGPIREGGRNVALTSVAGSLRNRGLDAETICVILMEVNRFRCEPPLAETEVVDIGRSIGRYPPGSPRYRKSSAMRVYSNRKVSS